MDLELQGGILTPMFGIEHLPFSS